MVEYRHYLDQVYERIGILDLAAPPSYVLYTPILFERWAEWAQDYRTRRTQDEPSAEIQPFGETEGPEWLICIFTGLEEFYEYYQMITSRDDHGR